MLPCSVVAVVVEREYLVTKLVEGENLVTLFESTQWREVKDEGEDLVTKFESTRWREIKVKGKDQVTK